MHFFSILLFTLVRLAIRQHYWCMIYWHVLGLPGMVLLPGTIVNRTFGKQTQKPIYFLFLLTIFGPIYYGPPPMTRRRRVLAAGCANKLLLYIRSHVFGSGRCRELLLRELRKKLNGTPHPPPAWHCHTWTSRGRCCNRHLLINSTHTAVSTA